MVSCPSRSGSILSSAREGWYLDFSQALEGLSSFALTCCFWSAKKQLHKTLPPPVRFVYIGGPSPHAEARCSSLGVWCRLLPDGPGVPVSPDCHRLRGDPLRSRSVHPRLPLQVSQVAARLSTLSARFPKRAAHPCGTAVPQPPRGLPVVTPLPEPVGGQEQHQQHVLRICYDPNHLLPPSSMYLMYRKARCSPSARPS